MTAYRPADPNCERCRTAAKATAEREHGTYTNTKKNSAIAIACGDHAPPKR